jgi:hypothetical protein
MPLHRFTRMLLVGLSTLLADATAATMDAGSESSRR